MIEFIKGNLLSAKAEALVNTVNCVGVMGKGIALQFKQAYPTNFKAYESACKAKKVQPGHMFITDIGSRENPKYIINFPTKRHWKSKSTLEAIQMGLRALIADVQRLKLTSIAIPPLGCGNGGLRWDEVRPLIEEAFRPLQDVHVIIYPPGGSPAPDVIKIGTNRPHLTKARALFISLMEAYSLPGYRLSLLEIQKLAYFLQEVGEPLKLRFVGHLYGPYAENLNHVLQSMDGHYIRGYGDRSRDAEIYLLPNAVTEASDVLKNDVESLRRLTKVKEVIGGFETPYGMELLATVHWICKENPEYQIHQVVEGVHSWSSRKEKLFKADHIETAWKHLRDVNMVRKE
ncbi:MAG: type II toxin-antitoxin system antitoxin DNA ADP-ribosyl glycohydrolase DarG [Bacilli bacterium]